jgi:peptidoglycan-associated lipoprotein
MNIKSIVSLLVLSLVLAMGGAGCKKALQKTTPLPAGSGGIGDGRNAGMLGGTDPLDGSGLGVDELGNHPLPTGDRSTWPNDGGSTFAEQEVLFDFDSHVVKASEVSKIEHVAEAMRGMPGKALRIEGHCDERGTEEYNRSLGERRALSVREYLIRLGIDPQLIETVSFGEDQPADLGHNEAAWAANRRGKFVVLTPPSQ